MSEGLPDPASEDFAELVFSLLPPLRESHSTLQVLGDWNERFEAALPEDRCRIRRYAAAQGEGWILLGRLIDHLGSTSPLPHCLDLAKALAAQLRPPKGAGVKAAGMFCDLAGLLSEPAEQHQDALELARKARLLAEAEAGVGSPASLRIGARCAELTLKAGDARAALAAATYVWSRLLTQADPDPEATVGVAFVFYRSGRSAEARAMFQDVWNRRAECSDHVAVVAGLNLVRTLILSGSSSDLISGLEMLKEIAPIYEDLSPALRQRFMNQHAQVLSHVANRFGHPASSLRILSRLVSTGSKSIQAADSLWILGRREEAIAMLRSVLDAARHDRFAILLRLVSGQLSLKTLDEDLPELIRELVLARRHETAVLAPLLSRGAMQSKLSLFAPTIALAAGAWLRERGAGMRPELELATRWASLVAEESWARHSMLTDSLVGKISQLDPGSRDFESRLASFPPLEAEALRHRLHLLNWRSSEWSADRKDESFRPAAVRSSLREREAAVEFIAAHMGFDEPGHLCALVTRPDREPALVDLGPRRIIETAVSRLHRSIRWAILGLHRRHPIELLQSLGDLIWRPIQRSLEGVDAAHVVADSELPGVPLEALIVDGVHLLEAGPRIRYACSSRELLRPLEDPLPDSAERRALLVGNPDFDVPPIDDDSPSGTEGSGLRAERRSLRRLPASQGLIEQTEAILRDSGFGTTVLMGDAASKAALLAFAESADVLMIVSHGFVEHREAVGDVQLRIASNEPLSAVRIALADHSISGLEIARLDLRRTELAILAACSSGVGERDHALSGLPPNSLDLAFWMAGCRFRISARHDVDEKATLDLMAGFWKARLAGTEIPEAFRMAQLALLRAGRHPADWAAFRLSGI